MLDVFLVAVILLLTAVTLGYMAGCDELMRTDSTRDEGGPI
jgi:hypothetical protein